ncbi:MAG: helix-turn-helix domain-containing protein [Clostridia bacterium]|nr:helix-turn-helix domain-containing protein [Clostridia bacterium]
MPNKRFTFDKYEFFSSIGVAVVPDVFNSYTTEPHSHESSYEIFICLRGCICIDVNSKLHELSVGDILAVAPGAQHHSLNVSEDSIIPCLNLNITKSDVSDELHEIVYPCVDLKANDFVMSLCSSLYLERDDMDNYSSEILEIKYQLFVAEIISRILKAKSDNSKSAADKRRDKLEVIESFFLDPQNYNLSARNLADMIHVSTRHLNRILISQYGLNFSEKMTNHRLARASWLLRNTKMSIEDIYQEVGYTSKSSFFKAFKAYAAMTPNQYRNSFIKIKKKAD